MSVKLGLPENIRTQPKIVVIGVGGAGGNAVKNMISSSLEGVEFWVVNTDAQALEHSLTNNRVQLGPKLTHGLGAGSHPEVGKLAAEESCDDLYSIIENSDMLFIAAGMGGGTGTGAAPVLAKIAKERGILTVAIVTMPFNFEGSRRMKQAEQGRDTLQQFVDTLIVIPNQNLFRTSNEKTTLVESFATSDGVLYTGVSSITDLITMPGLINLDFADIKTVMAEAGRAMMGTGEAEGEDRAIKAAEMAISNPLLDISSMRGAKGVLINITGGSDMTLFEVDEAANRIREEVGGEANIIFGSAFNSNLDGKIKVSVVATGIEAQAKPSALPGDLSAALANKNTNPTPIVANSINNIPEKKAVVKTEVVETFIPKEAVEPVNITNENSVNKEELAVTASTENSNVNETNKNSFSDILGMVASGFGTKEAEENSEITACKTPSGTLSNDNNGEKPKEDLFDIPAFLRRKMGGK
jgi:cell division protein FtsZ